MDYTRGKRYPVWLVARSSRTASDWPWATAGLTVLKIVVLKIIFFIILNYLIFIIIKFIFGYFPK